MPVAAAVVGTVIAAKMASDSAEDAAHAQEQAASNADATRLAMYRMTREDQKRYRETGYRALNRIESGLGPGGEFSRGFDLNDLANDPIYQERIRVGLNQGDMGIQRSAAARGGLLSGATLKALSRYNQDYASAEGNNAFNRFQTNRSNLLQPLQSLAGIGQTSTNFVNSAGLNTANAIGESQMQAGNARASGYIGQSNAINNGIGQAANWYQQQQMLDAYRGNRSFGGNDVQGNSDYYYDL